MSETLKDLLEYLQNKIDSGEHKIFFNDLGWDVKTIDCINAINEQQEEIERLNNIINELEQWLEEAIETISHISIDGASGLDMALKKIKELKGVDKE